jgi:hypothetical protein
LPHTTKTARTSALSKKGAPYVEPNKAMLGDKHLNPEESVARLREEETAKRHHKDKMPGQDKLNEVERSCGTRLHFNDLIQKLKKLNPRLLVKDGIPGNVALYRPKTYSEMERDGYDLQYQQWYNESKYVSGFPKDFIPEWGHLLNDTDGIANKEVRGWRSILIACVQQGAFTYKDAVAEFGDPTFDQRSEFWFQKLKNYR